MTREALNDLGRVVDRALAPHLRLERDVYDREHALFEAVDWITAERRANARRRP